MATKPLFVVIGDGQDGSYDPFFTFNKDWIKSRENDPHLSWPDLGCDGDGFHYATLQVPDHLTLEDLGISYDCAAAWEAARAEDEE